MFEDKYANVKKYCEVIDHYNYIGEYGGAGCTEDI